MEEALFAFGSAIMAVGVAVFLRMRTSRREAREEIVAFQKKIATIEQRTRQPQEERGQTGEGVGDVSLRQSAPGHPNMRPGEKYDVEFDSTQGLVERESGSNLCRFRMSVLELAPAAQQAQPEARLKLFVEVRCELQEQQYLVLTVSTTFRTREQIDLGEPLVTWTQAEKKFADEVIQRFVDEDR